MKSNMTFKLMFLSWLGMLITSCDANLSENGDFEGLPTFDSEKFVGPATTSANDLLISYTRNCSVTAMPKAYAINVYADGTTARAFFKCNKLVPDWNKRVEPWLPTKHLSHSMHDQLVNAIDDVMGRHLHKRDLGPTFYDTPYKLEVYDAKGNRQVINKLSTNNAGWVMESINHPSATVINDFISRVRARD